MYQFANDIVTRLIKNTNIDNLFDEVARGIQTNQLNDIQVKMINYLLYRNVLCVCDIHFNSLTNLELKVEYNKYPILHDYYKFYNDIENWCGDKDAFIMAYENNLYVDESIKSHVTAKIGAVDLYDKVYKSMILKRYNINQYNFFREHMRLRSMPADLSNIDYLAESYENLLDRVDFLFDVEEGIYQKEIIFCKIYNFLFSKTLNFTYLREVVNINLWMFENVKDSYTLKIIIQGKYHFGEFKDIILLIRNNAEYFKNINPLDNGSVQSAEFQPFVCILRRIMNYAMSYGYNDIHSLIESSFKNILNNYTFGWQILENDAANICIPCFDQMVAGEKCIFCKECKNYIGHYDCFEKYLSKKKKCPLCRKKGKLDPRAGILE